VLSEGSNRVAFYGDAPHELRPLKTWIPLLRPANRDHAGERLQTNSLKLALTAPPPAVIRHTKRPRKLLLSTRPTPSRSTLRHPLNLRSLLVLTTACLTQALRRLATKMMLRSTMLALQRAPLHRPGARALSTGSAMKGAACVVGTGVAVGASALMWPKEKVRLYHKAGRSLFWGTVTEARSR